MGFIYQILIEVDHLQDVPSPYLQIKGVNKEAVAAAGSALKLDGSYTTKVSLLMWISLEEVIQCFCFFSKLISLYVYRAICK